MMESKVNHPSHYNIPGRPECIVQMRESYGDTAVAIFCLLSSFKYLYRAGHKDDFSTDIEKAKWYRKYVQDVLECDLDDEPIASLCHDVDILLNMGGLDA